MKLILNRVILFLLLPSSVIFISSCQDDNQAENNAGEKQEHVWKDQTEAMEKARAVEGILQDSAEDLRQHIQDETE